MGLFPVDLVRPQFFTPGFLLYYSPFGEHRFMIIDHGKVRAWVRSNKPALVLGSVYDVFWKSRLKDHLVPFSLDSSGVVVLLMMVP
jgi:hypothetical protein